VKRKLLVGIVAFLVVVGVVLFMVPVTVWMSLFLRPGHDFDHARVPVPPNYTSPESWAALPERDDAADFLPRGLSAVPGPRLADVFYVHPTTYYNSAEWNAPLDDGRAREMRDLTLANQASTFNACCRVYAPVYRQASIGAYFDVDDNNLAAFRVAYDDVAAAFRYYLATFNQGRPFIIAGHSQGTMHALRLLGEIAASEAGERMVVAYAVGYRATPESFAGWPACRGSRDTGCAVAWDTFPEDWESAPELSFILWKGDRLVTTARRSWLCTNPISWSLGGEPAPSVQHLGSVLLELNLPMTSFSDVILADETLGMVVTGLGAPETGTLTARCEGSRLLVPRQSEPFRADFESDTGSYHLFDYDLFYMDIRQNAVDRVAAFVAADRSISE